MLFFFKQKTAYEMRSSDWSSDVCSSDLVRPQDALDRVGAIVAVGFVQPADAVVGGRHEHQVARAPGVELAVRPHAGHAHPGELLDVVPAHLLPFADQDRKSTRLNSSH